MDSNRAAAGAATRTSPGLPGLTEDERRIEEIDVAAAALIDAEGRVAFQ